MLISRYTDRITTEKDIPVRIVTAHPVNKKYSDIEFDFYEEFADGRVFCRNLYSSCMNGWRVAVPGAPLGGYYGNGKAEIEEWRLLGKRINCFTTGNITEADKNILVWAYPEFKYVLNKWKGTKAQTIEALRIWRSFPEVELLLSAGYENIAFNKSFWNYKKNTRKEIAQWLRNNPVEDYTLEEVNTRMKFKLDKAEYSEYLKWNGNHAGSRVSYPLYKYLSKQEEKIGHRDAMIKTLYTDYKKQFSSGYTNHNFKDNYWKYPKDFYAAHLQLVTEINEAIAMERAAQQKAAKSAERNLLRRLKTVAAKYQKYDAEIDGYTIGFFGAFDEWMYQAKELHQCIVASGFYKKMANRECLLAFIRKDGIPQATIEIKPNKKVGQFYGNEIDMKNCHPSPEIKEITNRWLETIEVKEKI